MKYIIRAVGAIVVLALAVGILELAASERVEVVELHTRDADGETVTTRLWIVDYEGHPYLRGESQSGWFLRLKTNELVGLTREGETRTYRHQLRNENLGAINRLMNEKYTWGDEVVNLLVGNREQSNAIELTVDQP